MSLNRIEKRALIKAPIARVWRAIGDACEFGEWFRVALEAESIEGAHVRGRITYPGYEHLTAEGRRPEALRMNDQSWTGQLKNVEKHVAGS